MTIKQSQLCVDKYEEIIINANGEAHRTGYYAVNYHRAGAQTIAKGQPIPISQFLHAIGWEA